MLSIIDALGSLSGKSLSSKAVYGIPFVTPVALVSYKAAWTSEKYNNGWDIET